MVFSKVANQESYPFSLPDLPYQKSDLAPHFSVENFDYHHGKHHNAYVVNLNNLLENNRDLHGKSLEEIIHISSKDPSMTAIFNNAAQIWNHTFYWHSMKPNGGGAPSGGLLRKIEEDFGSFENFASEFKQAGASQFGSGWVWLVLDAGRLKVVKTSNADTPITKSMTPVITCDVWEHAYYIDFRNRRPDYLALFLQSLVNWDFAENICGFEL